jgi:hypothetical protein
MKAHHYKRRLLKLATHLESGKLGHERFKFSAYNSFPKNQDRGPRCGTAGCAIGECPIVWPRRWRFGSGGYPCIVGCDDQPRWSGTEFFGLDLDEYNHLFVPYNQNPCQFGGRELGLNATRGQVAKGIREFVKIKFP